MEHTDLFRNTVLVKLCIPFLQWRIYKSTGELHSTFHLYDPNNECLCFADGEDGYQRLGNEIPRRLLDMAPRKSKEKQARSGYANYQTNLSVFLIVNQLGWWWCLGTEVNTQWPITGIISESISYWNKGSEIGIGFLYFPKPPGKTLIYLAFWRQCKSVRH